ncbi:acyl-CoA thioesterase [Blastomonas fulva]|jgi:acyl-CoA thioester hydrolase|uniref:acyl-CoA thioesterase n=1 Tax=Blastomonas fulva TaxID=1550728 RepID=UPI0024E266EC|nr:thioesterase family protein [Blastomonas fulva]MDK2755141.1 acyl-CoA thioesterase [Blastomonas fulva]
MTDAPTRAMFRSIAPKRVHYHEVDLQNIVFNANYLMFADVGITEYFRTLRIASGMDGGGGFNLFGPDHDMMVRHAAVDFRASAVADDMIDLAVRMVRIGNSSLTSQCAIFRGEELLTVVTISYVHLEFATRTPVPVPQFFRDMVAAFEVVKPEGC